MELGETEEDLKGLSAGATFDALVVATDWTTETLLSADSRLIERDFTPEQQRDFTIRKQILWESEAATQSEVTRVEAQFIRSLRSNDPAVGYNRWPASRQPPAEPGAGTAATSTQPSAVGAEDVA